jgi:alpha-beta hydrolase superfamily lysophospholipase
MESTLAARDGTPLVQSRWPSTTVASAGSLLLVHGLGEHPRRYTHVATALAAAGLDVHAYDQRGFGRSGGARGTLPHRDSLLDDLALVFERLVAERRAAGDAHPPYVLGHSMGGCLVARAVTGGWVAPRGMILSSPALLPRVSVLDRVAARAGSRLCPNLRVPSRLPMHLVSHDPAVLAAIPADTEMHDRVTPRLIAFLLDAGQAAIRDAARCRVPTLIVAAGDDHFCHVDGSRAFHAALPPDVGTLHVYERLYHEIFNECAEDRARVLADVTRWLQFALAPLRP